MKSSDIRNLVIVAIISAGGLAYCSVRYLHHRQWLAAHRAAQYAFTEAWISRDDPATFGPLRQRAEDAIEQELETDPWGEANLTRSLQMSSCIRELDAYMVEAASYRTRRDEGGNAEAEWKDWVKTNDDLHSCLPAGVR